MKIKANEIYHIYNQGNNQETIFYTDEDYLEILTLFGKYIYAHFKVLAYCLMPNHFHFLIYATDEASAVKHTGNIESCELSNGFRLLQSRMQSISIKRTTGRGLYSGKKQKQNQ